MRIPRTKGSKNKKTLLKEKLQETKPDGPIHVIERPEERIALRLFILERKVHDDFIRYISQFGDSKLYESYIVNEIMIKYTRGKIKLPQVDIERMHDFMMGYGNVGFEPDVKTVSDEFKIANRLLAKKSTNSFVQYQYKIFVDPDVKLSMLSKFSPSYVVNELLKLYVTGNIKIDMRDFRIKEWKVKYDHISRKYEKKSANRKDDI